MTLYDVLTHTRYDQVFHVYIRNDWDCNTVIGRGTRAELLAQEADATKDENLTFDYINNTVDQLYSRGRIIIVFINDEALNQPVETIWHDNIVSYNSKLPLNSKKFMSIEEIEYMAMEDN